MFDWNDEELTNIIWGEAEEGGDHIVPYPDANKEKDSVKNELNKEYVDLKPKQLPKSVPRNTSHGVKVESCSPDGNALNRTGYSRPDTSLTRPEKVVHDSEGAEASNQVSDISPKSEVETAALDTASELFQSPLEESEQIDFVDYGWASVGSFEDLDRIFSNEDPILGNASLGIADDLWTSCRDGTSSPEKSIFLKVDSTILGVTPLRNKVEQFDVEAEFLSDENQSFTPGYGKFSVSSSRAPQDRNWLMENAWCADGENNLYKEEKPALEIGRSDCISKLTVNAQSLSATNESMNKENWQKKLLRRRKRMDDNSILHGLDQGGIGHGNTYTLSDCPYAPTVVQPSSSLGLPPEVSTPLQLKILSSPLSPLVHGNEANQYAPLPSLSPFHLLGVGLQPMASGYQVSRGNLDPFNQPHEVPFRSLTMTPHEKIEKLRRRQQMRAMLAIQKQQQQFGSGESSMKYSALEGENIEAEENLSAFCSLDSNSPIQQDFSTKAGMDIDESSVADMILSQLQDTIAKLDMQIRLCMRDSLFRLAKSATQRLHAGGAGSDHFSSRAEVDSKEESNLHMRFPETCDVETETNPIDRTVAHLLFHRRTLQTSPSGKVV